MYAIAIPSWRRAERMLYAQGQITLAYVHPENAEHTYLFVRENEAEAYLPVAEKYGVGMIEIPDDTDNMRGTRDEMLKWAVSEDIEHLIMMDDDLRLDYKPDPKTYVRMTNGDHFDQMIDELVFHCTPTYPLTGITARQFSMAKTDHHEVDTRIIQVFCIHMPTIVKEDISFSGYGIVCMTDYAFCLDLLQRGYHNKCLNGYCRDDNSQTPGGCAEYRTAEVHSKSAVRLFKLYPGIVTPYVKTSGTWDEPRVNVRIAWKKAFRSRS